MGRTFGPVPPWLAFDDGRTDGADAGAVRGCYVHGLFDDDAQRRALLEWIGAAPSGLNHAAQIEATLDALADHLERHVRVEALLGLAR
jgi:adenosylcobyric acid synthase